MGDYTAVDFQVKLKPDTPQPVLDTLRRMLDPQWDNTNFGSDRVHTVGAHDHEFFKCWRWSWMLQSDGDDSFTENRVESYLALLNGIRVFRAQYSIKNYEEETQKLLSWLHPYIDQQPGDNLGTFHFEYYEEPAQLIFEADETRIEYPPDEREHGVY